MKCLNTPCDFIRQSRLSERELPVKQHGKAAVELREAGAWQELSLVQIGSALFDSVT